MDTELTEVRDFLAATPPFDLLPAGVLDGIPARLLVRYYRRGATILAPGDRSDALYVIRSGAVDLVDGQGAVSYTHLDVYKRQEHASFNFAKEDPDEPSDQPG